MPSDSPAASARAQTPAPVHTLICKRDLAMGRVCLASAVEASARPLRLWVHDDGTLGEADWDELRAALPGATFVPRAQSAPLVEAALSARPHCRAYRAQQPLSNKLLDIPLWAFGNPQTLDAGGALHYLDSDILLFRRYSGLFENGPTPIYLQQDDQGYAGPLLGLAGCGERELPSGCNTGLFRLPRACYDVDIVEWFLGRGELWSAFPGLAEQTCLALLMGATGAQVVSPRQIACSGVEVSVGPATVAVHFMSFVNAQFEGWGEAAARARAKEPPVELQLQGIRKLTRAHVVGRKVTRTLKSLAHR